MEKTKEKTVETPWISRLRALMEARELNPRSLSLKAGLNPTAVRDMLEGRVKYPRYDTVQALARTLGVTPAQLMSEEESAAAQGPDPFADEDLNLLTEIIARLQEAATDYKLTPSPKDFAAMVSTIYRQVRPQDDMRESLSLKIRDLMDYERLRRQA